MRILPRTRKRWLCVVAPLLLLVILTVYFLLIPLVCYSRYAPEEGDIVFQALPRVGLVRVIEGVTQSPYTHCGVVVKDEGKWVVIEAIGKVRKTPLAVWVLRGRGGRFAAYRLKEEYRDDIPQFIRELYPFLGRPYDFRFRMDDGALYCSELVYKAYKNACGEELGVLVKLGDLDWKPFEDAIRRYEKWPASPGQGDDYPKASIRS